MDFFTVPTLTGRVLFVLVLLSHHYVRGGDGCVRGVIVADSERGPHRDAVEMRDDLPAGESFEARFTPPRSGAFIYHTHADEVRQKQAGLTDPLIVVDDWHATTPNTTS